MDNNSRDVQLEKQIDAYIKGHLTEEEADRLWVELLKKPHYIDLLETELHVKSIIERRKQATPVFYIGRYWKWVAAAAFVGVLVVALNLLGDSDREGALAWPSINMAEHLASADIVRADESDLTEAEVVLNDGFKAAISGQPDRALQSFERIISSYPDDLPAVPQAYYNIGIIRYNRERFTEALAAFSQALERMKKDTVLKEKARWFLAHTHLHLNQPEQAREAIDQVYFMDGIYQDQASDLLERLNTEPTERRK